MASFASPYSTGNTYFDNGYQPNTINGSKLTKTGITIGSTGLKGSTSYGGKNMDSQNIWKDTAGNKWIWIRTGANDGYYIQYHPNYKGAVDFSGGSSASYGKYMTSTSAGTKVTNKINWSSNSPQTSGGSGGSGGYGGYGGGSYYGNVISDLEKRIYELEHPKVYSAQELADIYGIDYNEQNILNDYNKATNEYYDKAVKEQNDLRTQYAKNNAKYVDQVADSYINSYANAAPTAVGRGSLAANALSTQLNAAQINASNDYGMMQSVNNLEEARKAELKENPNLAKQYYNNIGTYLSGLSAELNKSDVKQYVDKLDAYSQMYAADRSYQAYLAQANAAKYEGLANAAVTNAAAMANKSTTAFDRLYNYFYTMNNGNVKDASNSVANLLKTSTGIANK